jgi:hypothetical protein
MAGCQLLTAICPEDPPQHPKCDLKQSVFFFFWWPPFSQKGEKLGFFFWFLCVPTFSFFGGLFSYQIKAPRSKLQIIILVEMSSTSEWASLSTRQKAWDEQYHKL